VTFEQCCGWKGAGEETEAGAKKEPPQLYRSERKRASDEEK